MCYVPIYSIHNTYETYQFYPYFQNTTKSCEYPSIKPNHQQHKIHPKPLPDPSIFLLGHIDSIVLPSSSNTAPNKGAPSQESLCKPLYIVNPPMDTYLQHPNLDLDPDQHTCLDTYISWNEAANESTHPVWSNVNASFSHKRSFSSFSNQYSLTNNYFLTNLKVLILLSLFSCFFFLMMKIDNQYGNGWNELVFEDQFGDSWHKLLVLELP